MAVQRLVLDTIADDSFELIAVHSSLVSYRLAYFLNKNLGLRLYRKNEDIHYTYKGSVASYPLYQYEDHFHYNTYSLFGNKFKTSVVSENSTSQGLFTALAHTTKTTYLLPEFKNVDYFLKIETETVNFSGATLLDIMLTIPQIITAYLIDCQKLKSKNNIIFE